MFELVNTSLPSGLLPGTHGFATVAMTRGLADNLRRRLEDLSAYVHKVSAHDATYDTLNPVAWSHLILPRGEHVLGRVAAAPFDYTGRTNRLARLVCLTADEAKATNAAETFLREKAYFTAPWEGEARWLEPDALLAARFGAPSARASRKSQSWLAAFGEADGSRYAAGFAALLRDAIRQNGRPLTFVTSQQSDPDGRRALAFIADLIALLPEDLRPSATFSTYPCAIPMGVKCAIRVLRKDDNGYAQAVADVPVADFAAKTVQNAGLLPRDDALVEIARTGGLPKPPAAPQVAAPQTPQSAAPQPPAATETAPEFLPEAADNPTETPAVQEAATPTASDVAIDVSVDLPSDGPIAVSERNASRRPHLLRRSAPKPCHHRVDPLFGQPRHNGNDTTAVIFIAVAAVMAIIAVGAYIAISGGARGKAISEELVSDQPDTRIRPFVEDEAPDKGRAKPEPLDRPSQGPKDDPGREQRDLAVGRQTRAADDARSSAPEVPKPLVEGITEIILFKDAKNKKVKNQFHPEKSGLSGGRVWFYDAGKGLAECRFNAKESGKDASWGTTFDDPLKYELYKVDGLPDKSDYCRIWHFEKNPKTLYWCFSSDYSDDAIAPKPPYGTAWDVASRTLGPDARVQKQWRDGRGPVRFTAMVNGEGLPDGKYSRDFDDSFNPREFIVSVHGRRLNDLERELEEARQSLETARNEAAKERTELQAQQKQLQMEYNSLTGAVAKAEEEYNKANEAYEGKLSEIKNLVKQIEAEQHNEKGATKGSEKKKFRETIKRLEGRKKEADTTLSGLQSDAQNKKSTFDKRDADRKSKDQELATVRNQISGLEKSLTTHKKHIASLEADKAAFPSLDDALRTWEIDVKIRDLDEEDGK